MLGGRGVLGRRKNTMSCTDVGNSDCDPDPDPELDV